MERICLYPKDIQVLTGKSERYARKLFSNIKVSLNKEKHQLLTIGEFCSYMGLPRQEVIDKIQ
ncbi:MAG: hypothetical protein WBN19_02215 [Lutimonas sp.]